MPALASAKELKEFKELHLGVDIDVEERKEIQPVEFALGNVKTSVRAIQDVVGTNMELYLTGRGNFREFIATILPYKGNRSEFDKPTHYQAIRDYLTTIWKAVIIEGQEADDEIGIRATAINEAQGEEQAVIVSIDKDLDTIPGYHYNFVTGGKYKVSEDEARVNFYKQILTGDRTDNILGLPGVGPKTADAIIGDATKESMLFNIVRDEYNRRYPNGYDAGQGVMSADNAMLETGRLVYIRKREGEVWAFPKR